MLSSCSGSSQNHDLSNIDRSNINFSHGFAKGSSDLRTKDAYFKRAFI